MSFSRKSHAPSSNSRIGGLSSETSKLLTTMMSQSGLNAFQQKSLSKAISTRGTLPSECPPESHIPDMNLMTKKYIEQKSAMGLDPFYRRRVIGKKVQTTIHRDAPAERDSFKPRPAKFARDKERAKLADKFEKSASFFLPKDVLASQQTSVVANSVGIVQDERDETFGGMLKHATEENVSLVDEVIERLDWIEAMARSKGLRRDHVFSMQVQIAERVSALRKAGEPSAASQLESEFKELLTAAGFSLDRPALSERNPIAHHNG
ncbi:mitochondrial UPF0193 superfamily member [Andalucia godoyi]|uniref:Mitochondrial UPF0193 superfamily member n=1 Tax=Andalucia godoyi TaxID=505711 RepID=A0A8K0AHK5_ANDGO|nr:mitochondrial UPF0193 superfamily member [Andalucia godoyi]|eukprot:ANDGO_02000.mRNA.1 mitochondrial UPF0193 superfamily member